jgi:hypothetical protein
LLLHFIFPQVQGRLPLIYAIYSIYDFADIVYYRKSSFFEEFELAIGHFKCKFVSFLDHIKLIYLGIPVHAHKLFSTHTKKEKAKQKENLAKPECFRLRLRLSLYTQLW